MTTRHGLYLASGIAVVGLLTELVWFVVDPKGDVRKQLTNRVPRLRVRF